MRITRSTLRRLIAEESARLLREAAEEEESTAMDEAERGKKGHGKKGHADCLYVIHGGVPYYWVAPCGTSERDVVSKGTDVTFDLDPDGLGMADALVLYTWLQDNDEITHVHDRESGGLMSKDEYMELVRAVGEEEGLFADDEFINEDGEALDETEDQNYNDDLQSRHGRFTSPENVKGTPQHSEKHRGPSEPSYSQGASRGSALGGGWDYSEYDHLREGAFPEELEGVYGEEPPEFDETDEDPNYFSDEFEDSAEDPNYFDTDYDAEPDYDAMDVGPVPKHALVKHVTPNEYDEEFMGDDDSWMDYETGEDDVPYGAADVALRKGRGHRTDEGHDPLDSSDYEGSRHHRAYSDDPDDESGKVDRWGEPIPYLKHDSEATDLDAAAEDEMAGEEEDWSWDGHDYEPDLKRTSRFAHTAQKYKETGNSDPGMDPDDHIFGRARGLDEARWARLAGILKG